MTSREKVNSLPNDIGTDLAYAAAAQNAEDLGLREDGDDDGEAFFAEVFAQVTTSQPIASQEDTCECGCPRADHACPTHRGVCLICYARSDHGLQSYCSRFKRMAR